MHAMLQTLNPDPPPPSVVSLPKLTKANIEDSRGVEVERSNNGGGGVGWGGGGG